MAAPRARPFRAASTVVREMLDASRSHLGREGGRALEFRWFPLAGLGDVDLHPSFLRSALARPMPGVGHIVQRDVRSDMPT